MTRIEKRKESFTRSQNTLVLCSSTGYKKVLQVEGGIEISDRYCQLDLYPGIQMTIGILLSVLLKKRRREVVDEEESQRIGPSLLML